MTPRWFRAAGRRFSCPCRGLPPREKHGSDGLARLKPCCDAADFLQAPRQEKQARSRQAIGVASEAHLRAHSRCFLTNFLWRVFFEARDPWLRAKKLRLLVCRSPLNALVSCFAGRRLLFLPSCGARRSFFCAGFVELRWPRVEAGAWKRVLGGWD